MFVKVGELDARIAEFSKRFKTERKYCEELFQYVTIRLLAHKYAYYVMQSNHCVKDIAYDLEESSWYVMGRALGHLKEDETSPCIDFDDKHPLANDGMELAKKLF